MACPEVTGKKRPIRRGRCHPRVMGRNQPAATGNPRKPYLVCNFHPAVDRRFVRRKFLPSESENKTLLGQVPSHECGGKETLGKTHLFNKSCFKSISAPGLIAGSFRKHCLRKSSRSGEAASGIGGSVSLTMRNMTGLARCINIMVELVEA